jgi:predicted nuclease of restriction endonuclease-like (RecB) superfamily
VSEYSPESDQAGSLYRQIRTILEDARSRAFRAINFTMVQAYWQIGRLLVESEQKGQIRAEYGKAVLQGVADRLTSEFGKGYTVRNLRYMRQFFLTFSKRNALRSKSLSAEILNGSCEEFNEEMFRPELSWSHYRLLLRVESDEARVWYMNEAADQGWSTRQLDRQISALYFERLLASRDRGSVIQEANTKMRLLKPEHFIRDPYVLEFLDLQNYPALRESTVEQAIIDKLQQFLLELGKGFSFVARQKRLSLGEDHFYVDLVFYNYILKCFILIDLKIGKLSHQDIGQMDSYVRIFEEKAKIEGDNPTIGLILCSEKNEAVAKYSILSESKQLFASKYMLYLPTEQQLEQELKKERSLIEAGYPNIDDRND